MSRLISSQSKCWQKNHYGEIFRFFLVLFSCYCLELFGTNQLSNTYHSDLSPLISLAGSDTRTTRSWRRVFVLRSKCTYSSVLASYIMHLRRFIVARQAPLSRERESTNYASWLSLRGSSDAACETQNEGNQGRRQFIFRISSFLRFLFKSHEDVCILSLT